MAKIRNFRRLGFINFLGRYKCPRLGEELSTEHGIIRIQRIVSYEEAVEEMSKNGVPTVEIKRFNLRVEHLLGDKTKYFECQIAYPNGEVELIDWSEYLAIINRRKWNFDCIRNKY